MKEELKECVNMLENFAVMEYSFSKMSTKQLKKGIGSLLSWPHLALPPINLWNAPIQFWKKNMSLTNNDIEDKLKTLPEIDLLEILEISSEDLVDRFKDRIEEKRDFFEEDLED